MLIPPCPAKYNKMCSGVERHLIEDFMIIVTLYLMKNILRLTASNIACFFLFSLDLGKVELLQL